jgi:hypothetical protein
VRKTMKPGLPGEIKRRGAVTAIALPARPKITSATASVEKLLTSTLIDYSPENNCNYAKPLLLAS